MPDPKYDRQWQKLRAQWVPIVKQGTVRCRRAANRTCIAPSPWIKPDEPWQLGHPDETCPLPTAPEHRRCNEATRLADRIAARKPKRRSRLW